MKWLGYPRAGYIGAAGAIATCTLVGLLLAPWLEQVNIALVYLLGVVLVALRWRRGPVVAASILAIAAYNFFFVPPSGTFHVDDPQYLLTFAMMLAVGLIVSWLTDTARRRAQAQAELAIQAETERIRNALLSSISHDLRTPLAVISGASSSLAEGGERMAPDERRALAQSIFRESQSMSELVAKVLQMTRLESGGLTLARDWCSHRRDRRVGGAPPQAAPRRPPGHGRHAGRPAARARRRRADRAGARQPARERRAPHAAAHAGAPARARPRRKRAASVSVEDFGPGLPEGDLERLFEKFRHGGRGGVGLGLAICRAIVALHGGRIWAERLPGVGTAFRFSLPAGSPAGDARRSARTMNATILVVEDEPDIRRFLRSSLGAEGYRVVESPNGRRGTLDAGMHKPDLAIVDLGLPDFDGIEVIRRIREWSPMPIVVLSARIQERSKIEALDAGADDYVTKPFGVGELLARVRVALRHAFAAAVMAVTLLQLGDATIDFEKRVASKDGAEVHLTPIEFRLLACLAKHLGMVVTHRQLLTEVWGPTHAADTHYLRVYMKQLAKSSRPIRYSPSTC